MLARYSLGTRYFLWCSGLGFGVRAHAHTCSCLGWCSKSTRRASRDPECENYSTKNAKKKFFHLSINWLKNIKNAVKFAFTIWGMLKKLARTRTSSGFQYSYSPGAQDFDAWPIHSLFLFSFEFPALDSWISSFEIQKGSNFKILFSFSCPIIYNPGLHVQCY